MFEVIIYDKDVIGAGVQKAGTAGVPVSDKPHVVGQKEI